MSDMMSGSTMLLCQYRRSRSGRIGKYAISGPDIAQCVHRELGPEPGVCVECGRAWYQRTPC
eukprot:3940504-Rhodomonas_salina.1